MALYGGCIFGPGATLWYQFLQRKIVIPGRPNLEIVAKVLTDQTVFASTNLLLFLSSMALMEGTDPKKKLEDNYMMAVKKNWMVWPAVQFINFKYVPLELRVLVVNIVSLGTFNDDNVRRLQIWTDLVRRLELLSKLPQQLVRRRAF